MQKRYHLKRPLRFHYLRRASELGRSFRHFRQRDLDDHSLAAADEVVDQLPPDRPGQMRHGSDRHFGKFVSHVFRAA